TIAVATAFPARPSALHRGLCGLLQLVGAEGSFEDRGDAALAVDREDPGLALEMERHQLRAEALIDLVVLVDLLVDPRDVVLRHRVLELLGEVYDRTADAALAERGRRDDEHDRPLAVGGGVVD